MADCDGAKRGQDAIVLVRSLLEDFRRLLARIERICGITSERIDTVADGLDEVARSAGTGGIRIRRRRPVRRPAPPIHFHASKVWLSKDGPSTFIVGGVGYKVRLTPLEIDLVSILKAPTETSPDALVGFRTRDAIINALREKYNRPHATARSVTVGIARLRETLGPTHDALIEWRRGLGYRLRVLAP